MPSKIVEDKFYFFFVNYIRLKIRLDILCESSAKADISHELTSLSVSEKNVFQYVICCSCDSRGLIIKSYKEKVNEGMMLQN